jgi:hypothetical protein
MTTYATVMAVEIAELMIDARRDGCSAAFIATLRDREISRSARTIEEARVIRRRADYLFDNCE